MNYVETNCTVMHEGKTFEAGGAFVSPESIVAYLGDHCDLTDWHGRVIGSWRAVRTWSTPRSFMSSTMSQIEATVDGIVYTGRSAGVGMVFKGKRKARE
jgi:hypothetical protein